MRSGFADPAAPATNIRVFTQSGPEADIGNHLLKMPGLLRRQFPAAACGFTASMVGCPGFWAMIA